jgi:hypothetical protein
VTDGIDWHQAFTYAGYLLMAIFSGLSAKLWKDVEKLKGDQLTREEFNAKIKEVETERDNRHAQNTAKFDTVIETYYKGQIALEKRLGEVMATIASLRPQRPGGEPERRRGY